MSITDELREWARRYAYFKADVMSIADRIDEQYYRTCRALDSAWSATSHEILEQAMDELSDEYIKAPVDADGVPWHLGDKVDGMAGSITGLSLGYIGWKFQLGDPYTFPCEKYRHHHEPTVEDVLDEFASAYDRIGGEDEEHQKYLNLIAEYAAKLRLADREDA